MAYCYALFLWLIPIVYSYGLLLWRVPLWLIPMASSYGLFLLHVLMADSYGSFPWLFLLIPMADSYC